MVVSVPGFVLRVETGPVSFGAPVTIATLPARGCTISLPFPYVAAFSIVDETSTLVSQVCLLFLQASLTEQGQDVHTGHRRENLPEVPAHHLVNQIGQSIGTKGLRTRQRLVDVTAGLLETHGLRDLTVAEWADTSEMDCDREFVERYCAYCWGYRTIFRCRNVAAEEGDARFLTARRRAVMSLIDAPSERIEAVQRAGKLEPRASAGAILTLFE
jgi:Tetracyclin repressor-like, C-terminal domain